MVTISAIILAKNEEKNIEDCIKSVVFCDEIVVVDDNSEDKTKQIAIKNKAKVITHSLENDFSKQRNFAIEHTKGDWMLFVDADERVPKELAEEIRQVINTHSSIAGYYLKRHDYMWGKFLKFGETGNLYLLRLAKRGSGKWIGKVHESWVANGRVAELRFPLLHFPHVTVAEFLYEINFYSTLRAAELKEQRVHTSWLQIVLYPKAKFLQNYVFSLGFLDGTPGLVLAIMMSMHSFLVRGKLWLLWNISKKE